MNGADLPGHAVTVHPAAGIAPYCSCGWPVTEGGKRMVWRPGDKTVAQHLAEVERSGTQ